MDLLLNGPFAPILAICAVAGLVLGLLTRILRAGFLASLVPPAIFFIAYYLTYQKIPDFPPAGATNKIFYIAVFATVFGLVVDLAERRWRVAHMRAILQGGAALCVSFGAALWIAQARLAQADAGFILEFVALGVGGVAVLWSLQAVAKGEPPGRGPFAATASLAVLPAAFAPLALFGASSTSVGLCLGLTVGIAIVALIAIYAPRPLDATAVLGTGGGLLAMIFTVAFIPKQVDYLLLPLLLAVPFFGWIGARLAAASGRATLWRTGLSIAVLAVALIALISGSLFLRHANPIGT
jgi:hypothetical protein